MPLPSSGALSIAQIRGELINRNSSYSLGSLASSAGDSQPNSISEFYGYSDTFSITYAMVAGGGGGGWYSGGGGGAGGYKPDTSFTMRRGTSYTITVGGGGSGMKTIYGGNGANGGDTTAFGTTMTGGGGGAGRNTWGPNDTCIPNKPNGNSGGSGGGATGQSCTGPTTPGAGTPGQGYPGYYGDHYRGSGAGGYSGPGGWVGNGNPYSEPAPWIHKTTWDSPPNQNKTYGGPGTYNSTFGRQFAGGGAGGNWQEAGHNVTFTENGAGLGGGTSDFAQNASANTGSGGGGGGQALSWGSTPDSHGQTLGQGYNGANGSVVFRYPAPQKLNAGTAWSQGGFIYHEVTSTVTFTTYQR